MLKNISWTEFFVFTGFLLLAYYFVVGIIFYRDAVKDIIKYGHLRRNDPEQILYRPMDLSEFKKDGEDRSTEMTLAFNRLWREITDAVKEHAVKEEILFDLKSRISQYPELKGTDFEKIAIQLIKVECAEERSLHLSKEELTGLWKG